MATIIRLQTDRAYFTDGLHRRSGGLPRRAGGRSMTFGSPGHPGVALVDRPRTSFGSRLLHRPRPGEAHTPYAPNKEMPGRRKGWLARVLGGNLNGWRARFPPRCSARSGSAAPARGIRSFSPSATAPGGCYSPWTPCFSRLLRSPSPVALPRLPVPAKPGRESGETREMLGSAQRRQQFLRPGNPTVILGAYSGHLKTFT